MYYKFTGKRHSQTTPSPGKRYPGPGNVFSTLGWANKPATMIQSTHTTISPYQP